MRKEGVSLWKFMFLDVKYMIVTLVWLVMIIKCYILQEKDVLTPLLLISALLTDISLVKNAPQDTYSIQILSFLQKMKKDSQNWKSCSEI